MASEDEVTDKREARAQAQQQQQAMQMAELAAKGYPGATKAPEEGSLAESLTGGT
jgi:hypothetical protein